MVIPVSIVTGFLGSGKTTLIGRLLRRPALARTAVIVNEWGEIGLDHELIATSDETMLTLTTGCLCCRIQNDLVATLLELDRRRWAGEILGYDRVLIETSGLADPAPILQSLISLDAASGHTVGTVLALVDARHGAATLERYAEARRQVALADRLLITKTDLLPATEGLRGRLAALSAAPLIAASDVEALFDNNVRLPWAGRPRALAVPGSAGARHTEALTCITIERDRPVPALALAMWLEALAEQCGAKLLRLKGLVDVTEMPGRPAVIHVVQHVVSEPEWLEAWPSKRRSRIVLIGQDLPRHFPLRLLAAIEAEVLEASGRL